MRSIILFGIAAGSLFLADRAASAEGAPASAASSHRSAAFAHDPEPKLDYGLPAGSDTRVYTGSADRVPGAIEYRRVEHRGGADAYFSGSYEADGRWTGSWEGSYEDPEGRRFEGVFDGTVEGHPGARFRSAPYYHPYYGGGIDPRYDADMELRCGGGGQAGGAVVGAVVGGVAGNRIAGRGDRTAGTVIGAATGALAGAAIAEDVERARCEQWRQARAYRDHHGHAPAYGHFGHGYGYYVPGLVVTTIITNGAPIVTETVETTTKTYYAKAPVRKRYTAKKRAKPKPRIKTHCVC